MRSEPWLHLYFALIRGALATDGSKMQTLPSDIETLLISRKFIIRSNLKDKINVLYERYHP